MNIKLSLIDNDFVVRAKTDIEQNSQDEPLRRFIQQMKDELVTGQTAYLEIEDSQTEIMTFEITQAG